MRCRIAAPTASQGRLRSAVEADVAAGRFHVCGVVAANARVDAAEVEEAAEAATSELTDARTDTLRRDRAAATARCSSFERAAENCSELRAALAEKEKKLIALRAAAARAVRRGEEEQEEESTCEATDGQSDDELNPTDASLQLQQTSGGRVSAPDGTLRTFGPTTRANTSSAAQDGGQASATIPTHFTSGGVGALDDDLDVVLKPQATTSATRHSRVSRSASGASTNAAAPPTRSVGSPRAMRSRRASVAPSRRSRRQSQVSVHPSNKSGSGWGSFPIASLTAASKLGRSGRKSGGTQSLGPGLLHLVEEVQERLRCQEADDERGSKCASLRRQHEDQQEDTRPLPRGKSGRGLAGLKSAASMRFKARSPPGAAETLKSMKSTTVTPPRERGLRLSRATSRASLPAPRMPTAPGSLKRSGTMGVGMAGWLDGYADGAAEGEREAEQLRDELAARDDQLSEQEEQIAELRGTEAELEDKVAQLTEQLMEADTRRKRETIELRQEVRLLECDLDEAQEQLGQSKLRRAETQAARKMRAAATAAASNIRAVREPGWFTAAPVKQADGDDATPEPGSPLHKHTLPHTSGIGEAHRRLAARLREFYAHYAPQKLPEVDLIVVRRSGKNEAELEDLWQKVQKKYGPWPPVPKQPTPDSPALPDSSTEDELEAQEPSRAAMRRAAQLSAPVHDRSPQASWVPDSAVEVCMVCEKKFTLTKRRHHCRVCGKVVCDPCSPHKRLLPGHKEKQRVCTPCLAAAGGGRGWFSSGDDDEAARGQSLSAEDVPLSYSLGGSAFEPQDRERQKQLVYDNTDV